MMLNLFGGGKPDHPMSDVKSAKKILDEIPAGDSFKAAEELAHWLESLRTAEGFKPAVRAQVFLQVDEAAQVHARKLTREYVESPRLSRFQEGRLWGALHEFWKQSALAFTSCVDLHAAGGKGADALKDLLPLLAVRALHALSAQLKWQYIRYGPVENAIWGLVAKVYAHCEARGCARDKVVAYAGMPGESWPEREFMRAVMLSSSSPNGLTPLGIHLTDRLIAHFSSSFTLVLEQQPDIANWIDLAAGAPPLRLARPPQQAPTLRFFAAGKANEELERLIQTVRRTNAVPSEVNLGGSYDTGAVLEVLNHLAMYWSSKPPQRKHPRHRVKSRLNVTHGLNGVLAALDPSLSPESEAGNTENWIVDNVSSGGFGALIPQLKGDWLRIGTLLGLQPEGGENWVIGVTRRLTRETPQQGTVGVQTLGKSAQAVAFRVQGAGAAGRTETGILLDPLSQGSINELQVLMHPGALVQGQNLEYEVGSSLFLLLPVKTVETGEDYELVRFRQMERDASE